MQPDAKKTLRHLLLVRSEWFEERVLRKADAQGYGFVTPSMYRMFAHLGHRPQSIAELARRLGVSRQAAHRTVGEAMRHGLVEYADCPTDSRMRLIKFSAGGRRMLDAATRSVEEIEKELEGRIGSKDLRALYRILDRCW